jgi:hypothetical protein
MKKAKLADLQTAEVESSVLAEVGYEKESLRLKVVFKNGGTYVYYNVPTKVANALLKADSKGSYLAKKVKPYHKVRKVA